MHLNEVFFRTSWVKHKILHRCSPLLDTSLSRDFNPAIAISLKCYKQDKNRNRYEAVTHNGALMIQ